LIAVCDLEFAFGQLLASRSTKRVFSGAVQTGFCTPGGDCWHGIGSIYIWVYSYTSRKPMARKYKYIRTLAGKVLKMNIYC